MTKEEIIQIIQKLKENYLDHIEQGEYRSAVGVHNEITRWQGELSEISRE